MISRRVLPDADVVSMASKDAEMLKADVSVSIRNLVRNNRGHNLF